ncbi:TPA: hypothetical protein L4R50_000339 [Pseudomonas aeruginosa]|nr:hypothetical protein [Pseudomonas aeruginosa]
MIKYIVTFILSMVVGLFAVEIALQAAGPLEGAIPDWLSYVLPPCFGLAGTAAIFLSRHDAIVMPRVKAKIEQGTYFWGMVFSTVIAGFVVFFLDDIAEEPIPEADRFMINSFAFVLVVLSVLMHLIKRHIKRLEKSDRKGDLEL